MCLRNCFDSRTIGSRLEEAPAAVLEVVRQVKGLGPFLRLADSLVPILPQDAGAVRALALAWAPEPWSTSARRWLQGQDLPDAELEALRLGDDPPSSLDVLRAIPAVLGPDLPMMCCCDQIESILKGDNQDRINVFTTSLMELLQEVPVQIVLSCFQDQWKTMEKFSHAAFMMRTRKPIFALERMKTDQAIRMVRSRIESWAGKHPEHPSPWPFDIGSIDRLVTRMPMSPRGLIQKCAADLDQWALEGEERTIDLTGGPAETVDLPVLFLKEWAHEIELIRKDPARSAENLDEARLYRGIFEALRLAEAAKRERDFGGVRVAAVEDRALKSTPASRKFGAKVTLAAGIGQVAPTLIVTLTKIDNARRFSPFLKALGEAMVEPVSGAVLIHPKRDLELGPGARGRSRRGQAEGQDPRDAAGRPPADARGGGVPGDLPRTRREPGIRPGRPDALGGGLSRPRPQDRGDRRPRTVQDARPLEGSRREGRRREGRGPGRGHACGRAVARGTDPAREPASRPGTSRALARPAARPRRLGGEDAGGGGEEAQPARAGRRAGRVRDRADVREAPVNPIRKTNFKGVSNKATDLKISLDLNIPPIVGSQAAASASTSSGPTARSSRSPRRWPSPPSNLARPACPPSPWAGTSRGQAHWLEPGRPVGLPPPGRRDHRQRQERVPPGPDRLARLAARVRSQSPIHPDRPEAGDLQPPKQESPYLRSPVAYDLEGALPLIEACMAEMDRRYKLLEQRKLSNVSDLPPRPACRGSSWSSTSSPASWRTRNRRRS